MIKQAVTEINAVRHCNNRCDHCNHGSAFVDKYVMDPAVLERDLAILSPIMHVGFLCLQGGEPLLHPDVVGMLDVMHKSGYADEYGVLTNGRLLPRMPEAFWVKMGEAKSQLRISVYPNLEKGVLGMAESRCRAHGIQYAPTPYSAFLPVFTNQKDPQHIFKTCCWNYCLTVHEGFFYRCPLSTFFPSQYMGIENKEIDGLPLEGVTEEKMQAFLNREKFLETCRICTGARDGDWQPWTQSKTKEEWETKAGIHEAIRDSADEAP